MINTLPEEGCKLPVIKYFEWATRRDFAYCAGVETMTVIAVTRLDKNSRVGEAFRVHFPTDVGKTHPCKQKQQQQRHVAWNNNASGITSSSR